MLPDVVFDNSGAVGGDFAARCAVAHGHTQTAVLGNMQRRENRLVVGWVSVAKDSLIIHVVPVAKGVGRVNVEGVRTRNRFDPGGKGKGIIGKVRGNGR